MWRVIHLDVGIHSVALDQPFAFRSINPVFSSRGDSVIRQRVAGGEPYLPSPGPDTNDLPQSQTSNSLGEGFPIGCRQPVAEHDNMSPKGVLHVGTRITNSWLPVEPRFAQQFAQHPRIDVASPVM